MKKKIAFVHNAMWEMYNFRGELLQELKAKGYEITVICPPDEKNAHYFTDLGIKLLTVPMSRKGTNIKEDLQLVKNLFKVYKKEKFDLVFHYTIKPNIYGTLAAKLAGIKSIAITTGLGYVFLHNNITSLIAKFMYKFSLAFANEVWFLNDDDMNIFLDKDLITERQAFKLPSEGINTKRFVPKEKNRKDSKTVFLMIARVLYDKGFNEYLEAAKLIKAQRNDVEFQLLGAIDSGNPSGVPQSVVEDAVSNGFINYLGTTSDVLPVISEADCMVLPSYREGISRVLMEAASMEKPIIATNVTGCREVINDGETGFLCKAKSPVDLAHKMAKIINMTEKEKVVMGQKGRVKVIEEMDLEKIIDIYDYKIAAVLGEEEGITVDLQELISLRKTKKI